MLLQVVLQSVGIGCVVLGFLCYAYVNTHCFSNNSSYLAVHVDSSWLWYKQEPMNPVGFATLMDSWYNEVTLHRTSSMLYGQI